MTMRSLAPIVFAIYTIPALGGVIPYSERAELVNKTLSSWFWGHARLKDGSIVQPIDEHDIRTMPITVSAANQVLDVGEISGYAQWCGLDWQSHFLTMSASARTSGFNQKQLAFIIVIHGLAQGIVFDTLKSRTCGDMDRAMVLKLMGTSPNKQF